MIYYAYTMLPARDKRDNDSDKILYEDCINLLWFYYVISMWIWSE